MPAFKWNDTTERMMLIKLLEQNPTLKFNDDAAVAAWPNGLEAPTKRGIGDRFRALKKQITNHTVSNSLGQGSTIPSITNTPQSIPATPRGPPKSTSHISKKIKTESGTSKASPNPISNAKGSSSTPFKSRLLNGKTQQNTNRKRNAKSHGSDDSEPSMSEHDGSSDSEQDGAANESPSESARAASEGRRSLPRRSKSMTPAARKAAFELVDSDTDVGVKKENGEGSGTEDGDGSFDPVANRLLERDGTRKRKATWEESIAMADGLDEDLQD